MHCLKPVMEHLYEWVKLPRRSNPERDGKMKLGCEVASEKASDPHCPGSWTRVRECRQGAHAGAPTFKERYLSFPVSNKWMSCKKEFTNQRSNFRNFHAWYCKEGSRDGVFTRGHC